MSILEAGVEHRLGIERSSPSSATSAMPPFIVTSSNPGPTLRAPQPSNHPMWKGTYMHPCSSGPRGQSSLLGLQPWLTAPQSQGTRPGKELGGLETHFIHPRDLKTDCRVRCGMREMSQAGVVQHSLPDYFVPKSPPLH